MGALSGAGSGGGGHSLGQVVGVGGTLWGR